MDDRLSEVASVSINCSIGASTYIPLKFEEKTDIEVRAIGSSSNANIAISAGLDMLYIENRPYPE